MADSSGDTIFDLKHDLLKHPREYQFFQALRMLRLITASSKSGQANKFTFDDIRLRPALLLSFPPADIHAIEEIEKDNRQLYRVDMTTFGLYGVSSPLPVFYTESLMEEELDDDSVSRDFIDIFNHRLYLLLFQCWLKHKQFLQVVEEQQSSYAERLFCLLGLGEQVFRDQVNEPFSLIRYIGLMTQFPRSALGLETLLKDALQEPLINIIPFFLRKAKIPKDQQFRMGGSIGSLGKDTIVGEEIMDRMGKFRISIGPVDQHTFRKFIPGTAFFQRLIFLVKFFILEPLEFDIQIIIASGEAQKTVLGGSAWSCLGIDTWSYSNATIEEVSVVYYPDNH